MAEDIPVNTGATSDAMPVVAIAVDESDFEGMARGGELLGLDAKVRYPPRHRDHSLWVALTWLWLACHRRVSSLSSVLIS